MRTPGLPVLASLAAATLFPVSGVMHAAAEESGHFEGRVAVEWIDGDGVSRDMRLIEDFAFVDAAGKVWSVPAGAVINGASIPRAFWSVVGPPFVGAYRRASVIHDYQCEVRREPWEDVHRMFYEASRAAGVDSLTAKVMYAAVYGGGPRWTAPSIDRTVRPPLLPTPEFGEADAETLRDWIRAEDPDLEEIERRAAQLIAATPAALE